MKRQQRRRQPTYTLLDVIGASATMPMPEHKRRHQLTRMWMGLAALERDPQPSLDDWRVCSDAANLLETLVLELQVLRDERGLLDEAIAELAAAGRRHLSAGAPIRLSATGIQAVRAILEDYAAALEVLPERTVITAHRMTERRITEILTGKRRPRDVEVIGA